MAASTGPVTAPPLTQKQIVVAAFIRWGFLGVVVASVPVLASWGDGLTVEDSHYHFLGLFGQGELLIVAAGVLGAALAEWAAHDVRPKLKNARNFAGALAFALLGLSALWFAQIQASIRDNANVNHHNIAVGSLLMFGFAVVIGGCCVLVAQFEEQT